MPHLPLPAYTGGGLVSYVAIQHLVTLHGHDDFGNTLPDTLVKVVVEHRLFYVAGMVVRDTWHVENFEEAFADMTLDVPKIEIVEQIVNGVKLMLENKVKLHLN